MAARYGIVQQVFIQSIPFQLSRLKFCFSACSDVDAVENEFCKTAHCVITNTGTVSCIPPCSHAAKCDGKYDRWPFDVQNCTLHIGTWVNSGEEIDYNVLKTIISEDELTAQNMEWRIIKATYKRNPGNFTETKQTYPSLTYSFLLERHSAEYKISVFTPAFGMLKQKLKQNIDLIWNWWLKNGLLCFLFTALVAINLITLWVDSRHNRRILLLSLNMILHFFAIHHMFWALPHNGDTIPDICKNRTKSKTNSFKFPFRNKFHALNAFGLCIGWICVNMRILVVRKRANHRDEIIIAKIISLIFTILHFVPFARIIRVIHEFIRSFFHHEDTTDNETKMNVSFTQDKRIRLTRRETQNTK